MCVWTALGLGARVWASMPNTKGIQSFTMLRNSANQLGSDMHQHTNGGLACNSPVNKTVCIGPKLGHDKKGTNERSAAQPCE
jgi:hypothetical protein